MGPIIWYVVNFGSALLFYGIGVYAERMEKPMGFWSGKEVKASELTDVEQYNRENARMWKQYALWFVAAGLAQLWSTVLGAVILILSCTVGLGILVVTYKKIYNKYRR